MKPVNAILATIAICLAFVLLVSLGLGEIPYLVMPVALAIWAYGDAKDIGMSKYKIRHGPNGPWSAALSIFLFCILFFPWYLINRDRVLTLKKAKYEADYPQPKIISDKDISALLNLQSMKESGILSEDEFALEKERILSMHR
jgi:hypothetical protein